jgi:hypothetical protein
MRRVDSSVSGGGGLGIGLRDGVSITTHLAKCLRRPIGLMTSLKMIDEGHDYERCCEQLLLDNAIYGGWGGSTAGGGTGGSRRGTTTSLRKNVSASLFDIVGNKDDVTPQQEEVGAEAALRREEEQWMDDGGHVGELGARILNCAKRVAPFEEALREEEDVQRMRLLLRTSGRGGTPTLLTAPPTTTTKSAVSTTAAVVVKKRIPLGTRRFPEEDDDMATQLFRNDFTLADLQRQEDILNAQQSMVDALRQRLGNDDEGRALLRSKLGGGVLGARTPSAKVRQVADLLVTHDVGVVPTVKTQSERITVGTTSAMTFATASGTSVRTEPSRSLHYLDSWEWSSSPSKKTLPVIKTSSSSAAVSIDSATHAAKMKRAAEQSTRMRASYDTAAPPLVSAVRLPPLAAPVAFKADVQPVHNEFPSPSPLRNNTSHLSRLAALPRPVRPKKADAAETAVQHLTPEAHNDNRGTMAPGMQQVDDADHSSDETQRRHQPHDTASKLHSALMAAALRSAESAYGRILLLGSDEDTFDTVVSSEEQQEGGAGVPLWSFEREQCFRDGVKDLEDFYGPQRLFFNK